MRSRYSFFHRYAFHVASSRDFLFSALAVKQKKQMRDMKRIVTSLKDELSHLETSNPESKTALQKLLEEHAEINVPNEDGFTALMLAARNGHLESVRALMECEHIDVAKKNKCESHHPNPQAAKECVGESVQHLLLAARVGRGIPVAVGCKAMLMLTQSETGPMFVFCAALGCSTRRRLKNRLFVQTDQTRCTMLQCTGTRRLLRCYATG